MSCPKHVKSPKNQFYQNAPHKNMFEILSRELVKCAVEVPHDAVLNKELRDVLDRAIRKLPLDYRIVFVMRDVEGLSTEEVGKSLKLSIPAPKSRLHRARLFLREELNSYFAK